MYRYNDMLCLYTMWCTVNMLVSIRQLFDMGFTQEIRTCWPCSHCCWAELEVVCLLSVWLGSSTPAYLSLTPSHGTSLVVILSKPLETHLIVQETVNGKILLFKWTICSLQPTLLFWFVVPILNIAKEKSET